MTPEQVSATYNKGFSINETARQYNISACKCRRMLICTGDYSSSLYNRITNLYNSGKSSDEISEIVKQSKQSVISYLPYSKGQYMSDTPTANALRIRKCRENKQKLKLT